MISKIIPRGIIQSLKNYKILSKSFGQFKSMNKWSCIDKENNEIPWYTYPAIEYLNQLDLKDKTVFEFGSGNSTLYWLKKSKKVTSVEDDKGWFSKIKKQLPESEEYILVEQKEEYINAIHNKAEKYDIIVIDGSYRKECAIEAIKCLKEDGFIILDNSDWRETASAILREADLIEVDFSGFGPINGYTWTTSIYLTRKVKLKPAFERQPINSIGSLNHRE